MDQETYNRIWERLTEDLADVPDISNEQPLLSHYTSIYVVEQFLAKRCLWLSNPLNMNDFQEVRYGVNEATNSIMTNELLIRAFRNENDYSLFIEAFRKLYEEYGTHEVLNLFVACFSKHDRKKSSRGKLSMWRGYGDQGNGAAIVFDTSKVTQRDDLPFILSAVTYLSNEEREQWIKQKVNLLSEIIAKTRPSEEEIPALALLFFRRAVLAAVFTKHIGFEEEEEWRLAYFPASDQEGSFESMIDYHVGPNGLEPKLKLRLEGNDSDASLGIDLQEAISEILIGPRSNTPLSLHAATIMLRKLGHEELIPKLSVSDIPFRG